MEKLDGQLDSICNYLIETRYISVQLFRPLVCPNYYRTLRTRCFHPWKTLSPSRKLVNTVCSPAFQRDVSTRISRLHASISVEWENGWIFNGKVVETKQPWGKSHFSPLNFQRLNYPGNIAWLSIPDKFIPENLNPRPSDEHTAASNPLSLTGRNIRKGWLINVAKNSWWKPWTVVGSYVWSINWRKIPLRKMRFPRSQNMTRTYRTRYV